MDDAPILGTVTSPAALRGLRPDVVVCDLHLDDTTLPQATIAAVTDQGPRVLAVSGPALREEILDAIGAGALGFVDKQEPTRIACLAAAEIARGGGWIGPKLAGYLVRDALVRPLPAGDLTAAELDVLRALAQGHSREETARRLGLDPTGLRGVHLRILKTERRRRTRLRPTGRQQEVMIKIGVEEVPAGRSVPPEGQPAAGSAGRPAGPRRRRYPAGVTAALVVAGLIVLLGFAPLARSAARDLPQSPPGLDLVVTFSGPEARHRDDPERLVPRNSAWPGDRRDRPAVGSASGHPHRPGQPPAAPGRAEPPGRGRPAALRRVGLAAHAGHAGLGRRRPDHVGVDLAAGRSARRRPRGQRWDPVRGRGHGRGPARRPRAHLSPRPGSRRAAQRAVNEIASVLAEVSAPGRPAGAAWADFIARLWPLTRRYRVLLALRRGEYGEEIHALLGPVDKTLADLVERGQDSEAFGRHLPADILSQVAYAAVFTIAQNDLSHPSGTPGARAAAITSLLILGVPEARADALVRAR